MTKLALLWLAGCALCVTPVAAAEDVYDGPRTIRPLTVTPKAPHSQADPAAISSISATRRRGGPNVSTAVAPQIPAAKRAPPSIDKRLTQKSLPSGPSPAPRTRSCAASRLLRQRRTRHHCGCHGLMADGNRLRLVAYSGVTPTATARRWSV